MIKTLENKYIILLWWIILIFILPWDQEKIVTLNLLVFCYILYFNMSATIKGEFGQKKRLIRSFLSQDISLRASILNNLIKEVSHSLSSLNTIISSVLLRSYNNLVSRRLHVAVAPSAAFIILNKKLETLMRLNTAALNKNILAAQIIILDLNEKNT